MRTELLVLAPQLVNVEKVHILGISTRTSNSREFTGRSSKISALWQRFNHDKILTQIPNLKNDDVIYGIYTNYINHHQGDYSLIAGAESDSPTCPNGLVKVTIQPGKYLAFRASSMDPSAIQETWRQIMKYFEANKERPRAFTTDFERYNYDEGILDIYIALQ